MKNAEGKAELIRLGGVLAKKARLQARIEEACARERAAYAGVREGEAATARAEEKTKRAAVGEREAEGHLKDAEGMIAKLRTREGEVRSSKAAAAYTHELNLLEGERARLEEAAYAALTAEEIALVETRIAQEKGKELRALAESLTKEKTEIEREVEPIIAELEEIRKEILPTLPAPLARAVEAMTRAGRSDIFSPVLEGACGACRAPVTKAKASRLVSGEIVRCDECGRFFEGES